MSGSEPEGRFTNGHQESDVSRIATLSYYEGNAKQYFEDTVNINMTVVYTPFLTYMRPSASILDAGCGSGRDTLYFSQRGYKVTAFDNAPTLLKLATKQTGQEVLNLSFQDLDFDSQFDGVWACSSLIHFPINALHDALSKLTRSLKTDGVMYTSFYHGKGEKVRDGRVFYDLDEDACGELLKQHLELAVIRCWRTSDLKPGGSDEKWLNLLVRKTRIADRTS